MRNSMVELIERAYDLKVYFALSSYELHHFDDGSYVDLRTKSIKDPRTLCRLAGRLTFYILETDNGLVVRLFEDYNE